MKKSAFFTLDWKDLVKGFITAVIGALLTLVYQAIQEGTIAWTWVYWQPVLITSIGAGIAYLLKNLFTNSGDQFAKTE